jgi:hypothetical protein
MALEQENIIWDDEEDIVWDDAPKTPLPRPPKKKGVVPPWEYEASVFNKPSAAQTAVNVAYGGAREFAKGAATETIKFAEKVLSGYEFKRQVARRAVEKSIQQGKLPSTVNVDEVVDKLVPEPFATKLIHGIGRAVKKPESTGAVQDIAEGGSRLLGEVYGLPGKAAAGVGRAVAAPLAKLTAKAGSKFVKNALPKVAGEAAGLATFGVLGDDDTNAGRVAKRAGEGALLGAIFGVNKLAHIQNGKHPLLGNIFRQFTTRVMAENVGLYDPSLSRDIVEHFKTGKPIENGWQRGFNEALFGYFSWRKKVGRPVSEGEKTRIRREAEDVGVAVNEKLFQDRAQDEILQSTGKAFDLENYQSIKDIKSRLGQEGRPDVQAALESGDVRPVTGVIPENIRSAMAGKSAEMRSKVAESTGKPDDIKIKDPDSEIKLYGGLHLGDAIRNLDKMFGEDRFTPENDDINSALRGRIVDVEKRRRLGLKTSTNLYRMGPAGRALADAGLGAVKEHAQNTQRNLFEARAAVALARKGLGISAFQAARPFKRMSTSETIAKHLADLVEGREQPQNENDVKALKVVRKIMADVAARAKASGMKINGPEGEREWKGLGENYFPREYADIDGFLNKTGPEFKHLRDKVIEEIANKSFEGDVEKAKNFFDAARRDMSGKRFGHLESPRLLDDAAIERIRKIWNANYPGKPFPLERKFSITGLFDYIDGANERIAWLNNFGRDVPVGKGFGMVPEKVKDAMFSLNPINQRYVENHFMRYLGRTGMDHGINKVLHAVKTWQNTKLALASIPNSLQWFNTIINMPVSAIPQMVINTLKMPFDRDMMKIFSETGAAPHSEAQRIATMSDRGAVDKVSSAILQSNGFVSSEYFNALLSSFGGRKTAIDVSKKLAASGGKAWRTPARVEALKRLGFKVEEIADMIKAGGLSEADAKGLADAAFYMRRITQFSSDAFNKPSSWSDPRVAAMMQFKNFAYNQASFMATILGDAVKFFKPFRMVDGKPEFSLGREGDPTKLMKAMVLLPLAGYLVTETKKAVYDMFGVNWYADMIEGKTDLQKYLYYIANAGSLGIAVDAANALGRGEKGMIGFIGGPTASDVASLWTAVGDSLKEASDAINLADAGWVKTRWPFIEKTLQTFVSKMNPISKIAIQKFFPKFKEAKDAATWNSLMSEARGEYMRLYVSKKNGPSVADDFWRVLVATNGDEFKQKFNRDLRKPTRKEIMNWYETAKSYPGIKEKKSTTPTVRW